MEENSNGEVVNARRSNIASLSLNLGAVLCGVLNIVLAVILVFYFNSEAYQSDNPNYN